MDARASQSDISSQLPETTISQYLQTNIHRTLYPYLVYKPFDRNNANRVSLFQDPSQHIDEFVWGWTRQRYFSTQTLDDFLDLVEWLTANGKQNLVNFYEVIQTGPCKFYVDLDLELKKFTGSPDQFVSFGENLKDAVIQEIINYFQMKDLPFNLSQDILLFTSHGPDKCSYHIIVDNHYFQDYNVVKDIGHMIKNNLPEDMKAFFDTTVYSRNRLFRTLYSCKEDSSNPRFKMFCLDWMFKGRSITYRFSYEDRCLISLHQNNLDRVYAMILLTHSLVSGLRCPYNLSRVNHVVEPRSTGLIMRSTGSENSPLLDSVPFDRVMNMFYQKMPELREVYRVRDFVDTFILLDRQHPAYCSQCDTVHDHENAYISIFNERGDIFFTCRRGKDNGRPSKHIGVLYPTLQSDTSRDLSSRHVRGLLQQINRQSIETSAEIVIEVVPDEEVVEVIPEEGITIEVVSDEAPVQPRTDEELFEEFISAFNNLPLAEQPDPNKFKPDDLVDLLKKIPDDKISEVKSWVAITGVIKSCRINPGYIIVSSTVNQEDLILRTIWANWCMKNKYKIIPQAWLLHIWDSLVVKEDNMCRATSLDLINILEEEDFSDYLRKHRGVKLSVYVPVSYSIVPDHRLMVDKYTQTTIKPFDDSKTVELVKSKMDTQKTRSLIKYIQDHPDDKWILYITSRFTMAQDAAEVLKETGRKIVFYTNLEEGMVGNKIVPNSITIIQIESLRKLKRYTRDGREATLKIGVSDLLILDECTSCCAQFSSVTMNGKESSISLFDTLVKASKKIIAMDADLDQRIVTLLLELRKDPLHVQWNEKKYENRHLYRYFDYEQLLSKLTRRVKLGEKIFVVCSTKATAHFIEGRLQNYRVRCHTSEESADDREDLFKVAETWVQYQVVIITSTITIGVNFAVEHFNSMYIFAQNGQTASLRDLRQMTGRIRKLSTGKIYAYANIMNFSCVTTYEGVRTIIIDRYKTYTDSARVVHSKAEGDKVQSLVRRTHLNTFKQEHRQTITEISKQRHQEYQDLPSWSVPKTRKKNKNIDAYKSSITYPYLVEPMSRDDVLRIEEAHRAISRLEQCHVDEAEQGQKSMTVERLAIEALIRFNSEPKFHAVNGEFVQMPEQESWITIVHILNVLERNKSNRYFEEEFEFMFKEQGIDITHRPRKEFDLVVETELDPQEASRKYDEADVISPARAKEIHTKITRSVETSAEQYLLDVYLVCKYFKEKPSYQHFRYFQNHRSTFINILLDKWDDVASVLILDQSRFSHRTIVHGNLDRWIIMKEFCGKMGIKNTVDPFTFKNDKFREKLPDGSEQIKQDWMDWLKKACRAFEIRMGSISRPQDFVATLRKIFGKWTGVIMGTGTRDHTRSGSFEYGTTYSVKQSKSIEEIIPLLKPWNELHDNHKRSAEQTSSVPAHSHNESTTVGKTLLTPSREVFRTVIDNVSTGVVDEIVSRNNPMITIVRGKTNQVIITENRSDDIVQDTPWLN